MIFKAFSQNKARRTNRVSGTSDTIYLLPSFSMEFIILLFSHFSLVHCFLPTVSFHFSIVSNIIHVPQRSLLVSIICAKQRFITPCTFFALYLVSFRLLLLLLFSAIRVLYFERKLHFPSTLYLCY